MQKNLSHSFTPISSALISRMFFPILWTARKVHEAFEAISWVSDPSVSRVLIKICCPACSCGAMIVAGTKTPTPAGIKEEEGGREDGRVGTFVSISSIRLRQLFRFSLRTVLMKFFLSLRLNQSPPCSMFLFAFLK